MNILLLILFALDLVMAVLLPLPSALSNAFVCAALAIVIVTENAR